MSLIKQTNSTKHMAHMCFQIYNQEPKFCVVSHLTEYLKRAKRYRDTDKLFLTCIKPYKVASKDSKAKRVVQVFIGTPLVHLELQLHPVRRPVEHRYPQSSKRFVAGKLNFTKYF